MAFMKKQQIDALWAHVHWLGVLADTGSYTAAAQRTAHVCAGWAGAGVIGASPTSLHDDVGLRVAQPNLRARFRFSPG